MTDDPVRRAIHARAKRNAARQQLADVADTLGAVPMRQVGDWSRARAAVFVAATNAAVQVLIHLVR